MAQEAARVYAEALFDVAKEQGQARRDRRASSPSSPTRSTADRELQVFLFSPYFSSAEKIEGLQRAVTGADQELVNFLELLIEKHRMTEIFRIRQPASSSSGSRRTGAST